MIVYLAGHSLEFEYRKYCKDTYSNKFTFIDPIDRSLAVLDKRQYQLEKICNGEIELSDEIRSHIVEEDKKDILRSDILVAYIRKPTFGTIMEIMFAHVNKKPIYVVNPHGEFVGDVWLKYHATMVFKSIDACFTTLGTINNAESN